MGMSVIALFILYALQCTHRQQSSMTLYKLVIFLFCIMSKEHLSRFQLSAGFAFPLYRRFARSLRHSVVFLSVVLGALPYMCLDSQGPAVIELPSLPGLNAVGQVRAEVVDSGRLDPPAWQLRSLYTLPPMHLTSKSHTNSLMAPLTALLLTHS